MIFLTVILFLVYPILTFPIVILGTINDKKYRLIYMILIAFDIALIALHFDPSSYNLDLNVYFSTMDLMKKMNWETFFQTYYIQKEFLTNVLFYIFANIGNNGIWTFFVTFLSYSLLFYIITDYAKIKGINDKNYFLMVGLLILLYNNFFIMTGIRNTLAMVLFLWVLYLEYIKEKKNVIYKILYILPCLVHMSMILAIILRILLNIYKTRKKKYVIIGLFIYALSPNVILPITNKLSGIAIFSDLFEKTTIYVINQSDVILENILYVIKIIAFINLFIIFEKIYKNENSRIRNATELICLFTFFSFNYTTIMYRWFDICTMLLCLSFINKIEMYKRIKGIYKIILALSLLFCLSQQLSSFYKTNYFEIVKETYSKTLIENFKGDN